MASGPRWWTGGCRRVPPTTSARVGEAFALAAVNHRGWRGDRRRGSPIVARLRISTIQGGAGDSCVSWGCLVHAGRITSHPGPHTREKCWIEPGNLTTTALILPAASLFFFAAARTDTANSHHRQHMPAARQDPAQSRLRRARGRAAMKAGRPRRRPPHCRQGHGAPSERNALPECPVFGICQWKLSSATEPLLSTFERLLQLKHRRRRKAPRRAIETSTH